MEADFGAGSKLLRGVVALEVDAGAARPAPLGVSLEGRVGFRGGCSSVPKVEPVGGREQVHYNFTKDGWTHLPFRLGQPILRLPSAQEHTFQWVTLKSNLLEMAVGKSSL